MGLTVDARDFHFAGFRLEAARGTLTGPDGRDHRIRPKSFALLVHLLENPGRLHGREELLDAIWPDVVVSDDSLTQCVSELRRCFGPTADAILRTLPRRGYMLVVDVEVRAWTIPSAAPAPSVSAFLRTTEKRSPEEARCASVLVEMPDGSSGPEVGVLASVSVELARYEDLRVRRAVGSDPLDYRIRCVETLADGSTRPLVVLEDALHGSVVWTDYPTRPGDETAAEGNAFEIVANRIARQIAFDSRRKAREKLTDLRNARDLCLLASDHHQRATEQDTVMSLELLREAIALDPAYPQAHAWLAYATQRGFTQGWGPVRGVAARDAAMTMARAAVALAPYSPLCLSRLAYCMMLHGLWSQAEITARMALNGPFRGGINVRVTCCEVLAHASPGDESVDLMKATIRLDPFCAPTVYSVLGRCLLMAGRPDEALPHLQLCAARLPDYAPCHHSLVMAFVETGQLPDAVRAWRDVQRLQPGWDPHAGTGPWFFRRPEDERRMLKAVNAVRAM
ncbi:MAG: winged helix-turn-helix domain-containing protein [Alsobacter sp.]